MRWALSLLEDLMPKCARFVFSSKLESYDLAHEMNLAQGRKRKSVGIGLSGRQVTEAASGRLRRLAVFRSYDGAYQIGDV